MFTFGEIVPGVSSESFFLKRLKVRNAVRGNVIPQIAKLIQKRSVRGYRRSPSIQINTKMAIQCRIVIFQGEKILHS